MNRVGFRYGAITWTCAAIVGFQSSAGVRAEDWSQWRGPNRDGVCHETGLLEAFPAEGLKVRWRVPVGWGFSSPVVAQGRVFVSDAQLERPKVDERILFFDEVTGKHRQGSLAVGQGDRFTIWSNDQRSSDCER